MDNKLAYDLAVAYRIYPGISKHPAIYNDDKLKLAALCLRSFQESLGDVKAKIFVLLDNCPLEYETLFLRFFNAEDLEFIRLEGEGNARTFERQIQVLLEQTYSNNIYFAEDDYFYLPNQFASALSFMETCGISFISLYDHIDTYKLKVHMHKESLAVFAGKHWRTASSTCLTFLTTKAVMLSTKNVFLTYSKNNYDASIWFSLTKRNIQNPFKLFKSLGNLSEFKLYLKAWLYCSKTILFGKKWYLWTLIPAGCTHMEITGLAPNIDWQSQFFDNDESKSNSIKKTSTLNPIINTYET